MESSPAPSKATVKRLWQIISAVFVMFREALGKRHLLNDLRLHFLFHQGKLAGKSLRSLILDLSHQHPSSIHATAIDAFSCRFMDPDAAIFAPREVEFSCSSTPHFAPTRRRIHHVGGRRRRHNGDHAAEVARAFEILDSVPDNGGAVEEVLTPLISVLATPAPTVRPLRVTDSPFPLMEEEDTDEVVDLEAEEFIRQFYEQLRRQQMWSY
ncbi:uncharacterized protein LOC110109939 [Dendrobium catenatum]|uniref:Uncharacterized protein n=1 Tax=Dendrobium catenatum TaxID=906689 RepID=A0A2I0X610_9ASPA|nr:uncharacterized protein LOC110109939 [Dendrobium catenatum]PKU83342.1 hypothetical protein MA16_Dca016289 [Dendrobium catenatum]